jgi:lipopolysaccharide/colanic/teichoic acid biosynthesis glycosyltransferase
MYSLIPHPDQNHLSSSYEIHASLLSKAKRLIDVILSIIGLSLTAIIAIPIAIAMQLDNPGPLFYSQIRCGLNGKPFRMWKFRSMIVNADQQKHLIENQAKGFIFKNDCDPRITRVGGFLRKTSLDEFPQFLNVLKGEMSIVGTRPPTPDEVANYDQHHWQRLSVKPGITGEWQTNGRSSIDDFEQIVLMDLNYQLKWSVWYDIYLIWKTITVVLRKEGAY